VLDAIRGVTVTNGLQIWHPNREGRYIEPTGPGLDPTLFNLATDGTQVLIMTPKLLGSDDSEAEQYAARNEIMVDTIIDVIGGNNLPEVRTYVYDPLNHNDPNQVALGQTTRRGVCLFQYDPDSDGQGTRAWRLFYEHRMYSGLI
jgi:hypothetical protein